MSIMIKKTNTTTTSTLKTSSEGSNRQRRCSTNQLRETCWSRKKLTPMMQSTVTMMSLSKIKKLTKPKSITVWRNWKVLPTWDRSWRLTRTRRGYWVVESRWPGGQ